MQTLYRKSSSKSIQFLYAVRSRFGISVMISFRRAVRVLREKYPGVAQNRIFEAAARLVKITLSSCHNAFILVG